MSASTSVYRAYGADGALLYVGCSGNVERRFKEHSNSSRWYEEMTHKKIRVYPSRERALAVEARAIKMLRPLFNGVFLGPTQERLQELAREALPEAPDDRLCTECGERVFEGTSLVAPHPFIPGDTVTGCPHCCAVDSLTAACVVATCCEVPSAGTPGKMGYRYTWTCRKHHDWESCDA